LILHFLHQFDKKPGDFPHGAGNITQDDLFVLIYLTPFANNM
jgi:hypothetical protein